jgi:hypothetical protein
MQAGFEDGSACQNGQRIKVGHRQIFLFFAILRKRMAKPNPPAAEKLKYLYF